MGNEITPVGNGQLAQQARPIPLSIQDVQAVAKAVFLSKLYPNQTEAQLVVKILRGQEFGLPPIGSIENIYTVNGKTGLLAVAIGAKIKDSGRYDYRIKTQTDTECVLTWYQDGKEVGDSSFTMADADRAGLMKNPNYRQYPSDMLYCRSLTRGARRFCPSVFGGPIYTPDELRGITLEPDTQAEAAEVVDATPENDAPITADPVTDAQIRKIGALRTRKFGEHGMIHGWVSDVIGRQITSAKELSKHEASQVIDAMTDLPDHVQEPDWEAENEPALLSN